MKFGKLIIDSQLKNPSKKKFILDLLKQIENISSMT